MSTSATNIAETLGIDGPLTPELGQALAAARIRQAAVTMLMYHCSSCKNAFDEETVEAVIKRAAANTHGSAITPELEAIAEGSGVEREIALSLARIYDNADAMLKYQCKTCKGAFDEETVEAVIKRAAANTHGNAITPELELVAS